MRGTGPGGSPATTGPASAPAPDVTVVTVTYEAADLVLDCLGGLAAQRLGGSVEDLFGERSGADRPGLVHGGGADL